MACGGAGGPCVPIVNRAIGACDASLHQGGAAGRYLDLGPGNRETLDINFIGSRFIRGVGDPSRPVLASGGREHGSTLAVFGVQVGPGFTRAVCAERQYPNAAPKPWRIAG